MESRTLRHALISVFNKDGLEPIIRKLHALDVVLFSTGGTQKFISQLGIPVEAVEDLTDYPSILDGRVKTLHPKIFGGILARRVPEHQQQLMEYDIPEIDLVIVDLYPFEETLKQTSVEDIIIEKIDIGGVSLIRAAAKNYRDVLIVPCQEDYPALLTLLEEGKGASTLDQRRRFAQSAFQVTAHYDGAISTWFGSPKDRTSFSHQASPGQSLRYGENPHQKAQFYGDLEQVVQQLHGKMLSYNNLVDTEAALQLISEFADAPPTTVVIKHTNACGVASRPQLLASWEAALAADPISAFGGIIAVNRPVDLETAQAIDNIFYEVLLSPGFDKEALALLQAKKNRILLTYPSGWKPSSTQFRSLLGGVLAQDVDHICEGVSDLKLVSERKATEKQLADLVFANICVKHLKSNGIALVRDQQLLGMGCGQTSRVDALKQAIAKAKGFGFSTEGACMASDAFFPFPDCVEIADHAGIQAVIHPGGSVKDQDSIDYCNAHNMVMVMTGNRHFKH